MYFNLMDLKYFGPFLQQIYGFQSPAHMPPKISHVYVLLQTSSSHLPKKPVVRVFQTRQFVSPDRNCVIVCCLSPRCSFCRKQDGLCLVVTSLVLAAASTRRRPQRLLRQRRGRQQISLPAALLCLCYVTVQPAVVMLYSLEQSVSCKANL